MYTHSAFDKVLLYWLNIEMFGNGVTWFKIRSLCIVGLCWILLFNMSFRVSVCWQSAVNQVWFWLQYTLSYSSLCLAWMAAKRSALCRKIKGKKQCALVPSITDPHTSSFTLNKVITTINCMHIGSSNAFIFFPIILSPGPHTLKEE